MELEASLVGFVERRTESLKLESWPRDAWRGAALELGSRRGSVGYAFCSAAILMKFMYCVWHRFVLVRA